MYLIDLAKREMVVQNLTDLPYNSFKEEPSKIHLLEQESRHLRDIDEKVADEFIATQRLFLGNLCDLWVKKVIHMVISDAYRDNPFHQDDPMLPEDRLLYYRITEDIKEMLA